MQCDDVVCLFVIFLVCFLTSEIHISLHPQLDGGQQWHSYLLVFSPKQARFWVLGLIIIITVNHNQVPIIMIRRQCLLNTFTALLKLLQCVLPLKTTLRYHVKVWGRFTTQLIYMERVFWICWTVFIWWALSVKTYFIHLYFGHWANNWYSLLKAMHLLTWQVWQNDALSL